MSVVRALFGPSSPPSLRTALELTAVVFTVGAPLAYAAALPAAILTYVTGRRGTTPSRRTLWIIGAILGLVASLALAPYLRGDLFSIRFPWCRKSPRGYQRGSLLAPAAEVA